MIHFQTLVGLIAFGSMTLTSTSQASLQCKIFLNPENFVQKKLVQTELSLRVNQKNLESLVRQLNQGGTNWSALSASDMQAIHKEVEKYQMTQLENVERVQLEAIDKIALILVKSSDLAFVRTGTVRDAAIRIATKSNPVQHGPFGLMGTSIAVYLAKAEILANQVPDLSALSLTAKNVADFIMGLNRVIYSLKGLLPLDMIKDVKTENELVALADKLEKDYAAATTVPADVVQQWLAMVKKYDENYASFGDILTAAQGEAVESIRTLVQTHSFFRQLDALEKSRILNGATRVSSAESIQSLVEPAISRAHFEMKIKIHQVKGLLYGIKEISPK